MILKKYRIKLLEMSKNTFLAFDLGASGGRAIAGILKNGKLELKEVHRFKNQMTLIHGSYYWNIFSLFDELKKGLKKCIDNFQICPQSVAVDTWGVDYSLISGNGQIIGLPYAYRDHRTNDIMDDFFNNILSKEETYLLTGIQFMQFNSLFQLYASIKQNYPGMDIEGNMLCAADTINSLFTDIRKNE